MTQNTKDTVTVDNGYSRPECLVETDWLERNLDAPELRIFDCAALPAPNPDEALRKKFPLKPQSGRASYEKAHVPGAGFIDVPGELTDKSSEFPMMMPPIEQVIDVMSRSGIGDGARVVLYSSTNPMWATRVWWILRAVGFDNAAILNGGLTKWTAEARQTSTSPSTYKPEQFIARPRPDVFVDKQVVRAALGAPDVLLIHALTPSVYDGSNDALVFGRRGRIPGSVNIPSGDLHQSETGAYLPAHQLHEIFKAVNAHGVERIITYCGAGVNATNDAFALCLLGYETVAVYDGSMSEWGNDESLPIEVG